MYDDARSTFCADLLGFAKRFSALAHAGYLADSTREGAKKRASDIIDCLQAAGDDLKDALCIDDDKVFSSFLGQLTKFFSIAPSVLGLLMLT